MRRPILAAFAAAAALLMAMATPALASSPSPDIPYGPNALENLGLYNEGAQCCYGTPSGWAVGPPSNETIIDITGGTWQVYEDDLHEGQCWGWNNAEALVVDQNCTPGATWQLWRSKYLPNVGGGVWEIWNDWEVINRGYACGSYNAVVTAFVQDGPMFLDCPQNSGGTAYATDQLWEEIGS